MSLYGRFTTISGVAPPLRHSWGNPSSPAQPAKGDLLSRGNRLGLSSSDRGKLDRETKSFAIEPDIEGYDLCPDPLTAKDAAEFVDFLNKYRIWAGDPSYREIANRCGKEASASTFCKALKGTELPRQRLVRAFIRGCGGDEKHVALWITGWRRLKIPGALNGSVEHE